MPSESQRVARQDLDHRVAGIHGGAFGPDGGPGRGIAEIDDQPVAAAGQDSAQRRRFVVRHDHFLLRAPAACRQEKTAGEPAAVWVSSTVR